MNGFVVVIPARYASERLPGKPLRLIAGKPMLQHVYELCKASEAASVIIATDDQRIQQAAESFSAECYMTSDEHRSGTDRIAEVARGQQWPDDRVIVNVQGDEPMLPPIVVNQCAALMQDRTADVATLASPLQSGEDFKDPNVVKAIVDNNGFAIYFSRLPIPCARRESDAQLAWQSALHHHGIYAYRNSALQKIVAAPPSPLETCEQLEQLRVLSMGLAIKVAEPVLRPGIGVDTEADLQKVESLMANRKAHQ